MLKQRFLIEKQRPEATTTILYFHGIFSTAHSCKELEHIAKSMNYNFLGYTMPMHGNNHSEGPDDLSLESIRSIIKELVKRIKTTKIILASHSAGANWVAESIRMFGEKHFSKIILVSPINSSLKLAVKNKFKTIRQLLIEKRNLNEIFADLTDANVFFYEFAAVEKYRYYHFLKMITSEELLKANDEVFAKLTIPTLIILGKSDIVIDPSLSFELFSHLNAKLVIKVFDAGHSPQIDQKQVFNELVTDFLKIK